MVLAICGTAGAQPASDNPPAPAALKLLLKPVPDCARPAANEIVVCGRDREAERQALPLPSDPAPGDLATTSVSRERSGLVEDNTGKGPINCGTAIGSDAGSGCLARDMQRAKQQAAGRDNAPK